MQMDSPFLSPEQIKRLVLSTPNSPSDRKSTSHLPDRTPRKVLSTAGLVGNYTYTITIREPNDPQGFIPFTMLIPREC